MILQIMINASESKLQMLDLFVWTVYVLYYHALWHVLLDNQKSVYMLNIWLMQKYL